MRVTRPFRCVALACAMALALAGCAEQQQPPPSPPSHTAPALTWRDACLLKPAALNPILARSTSEPNAKIGTARKSPGDQPACRYRPLASPAAYPLVTIYPYGSTAYSYLSMPEAAQTWRAPNPTKGYKNACRAATASAHADGGPSSCQPKVLRGAVFGATEAVVFLDKDHFAVVELFDISYQDPIMPTFMAAAIKQVAAGWAAR